MSGESKAGGWDGISQVERSAAAALARGDREELFGAGHRFAALVRASFSAICESMAPFAWVFLPGGHNPIQGKTRFIIITPTPDDYEPFRAELEQRIIH